MLRRFLDWWNSHQRLADGLLAVVACTYLLVEVPYHDETLADAARLPPSFWGDVLAYGSLAWRRRHPVPVLGLVCVLWLLSGRWDIWAEWNASWAELSTPTALMLMCYTAGRWASSRLPALFIAATLLPVAITAARAATGWDVPVPTLPVHLLAMSTVLCAAAWGLGRLRRSEAEALARGLASQAQAMLTEERMRIAREVHDIVAHNVSAMVIQADGAAAAMLDGDLEEAGQAIDAIGGAGRSALRELRLLLGLLRETPAAEQPGIEEIKGLVERTPLQIRLRIEGHVCRVSPGLSLAAYRIVQEALTNTLKHAGKDATADVLLRYADDGLRIQVTDDGAGRRRPRAGVSELGAGRGLAGIHERAAMFGGSATATSLRPGGFRIEAWLPWI